MALLRRTSSAEESVGEALLVFEAPWDESESQNGRELCCPALEHKTFAAEEGR